jgi:hypothetical protein
MKKFFLLLIGALYIIGFSPNKLAAQDWSGVLDSTVNYTAGAGEAQDHSFGIEQFTNLRLRVRGREKATFFAAFNLIALAGNYAQNAGLTGSANLNPYFASTPFIYGQNYAAALELERLYFRINGDYVDSETGLLRMNFGYGQVWGSSDFLNPRNPLFPNARPRGVLGMNAAIYPQDSLKLMGFVAAPKNPLATNGGGFIPGLSLDKHWDRASLQALYAYETPEVSSESSGIHRIGLSVKADIELGFVLDALYTLNSDNADGIDVLSLGAGFDYNFLDGDLYVLAEYLYNGHSSATARGYGGDWSNNHYLYGTALYRFNDYCSLSLSTLFCFDDFSFSPFATFNYELFQGFSLNATVRVPLDQKTLSGGKTGELGPIPPRPDGSEGTAGAKFIINAGAKLRF